MIFNTYSPEKSSNQTDSLIIILSMTKPIGSVHKEAKPQERSLKRLPFHKRLCQNILMAS